MAKTATDKKMSSFLFTSESVGEGHPDKMCDHISDAVLDACLKQDPMSRVACGFDYKTCGVQVAVGQQSQEISNCVTSSTDSGELGAGDQGLMFGYATDESSDCMPLTVTLAHNLNKRLAECRRDGTLPWLRPDTKTQVTIEYVDENGDIRPVRIHTVVVSTQHSAEVTQQQIKEAVMEKVIKVALPPELLDDNTIYYVNPSGAFIYGGPMGDAGLTGRKIIVDTYGGWGAHGGGAFSGKDPTKVDRSAAYAARWVAKSLVKAKLCKRVLVQVSYAIGIAKPLSISVFPYGTCKYSESQLLKIVNHNFDLRPGSILRDLDLRRPIYRETARYGHFGGDKFPWEKVKTIAIPEDI